MNKSLTILAILILGCANLSMSQSKSAPTPVITLTLDNSVTFRGEVNDASVAKAEIELLALISKRNGTPYPIYLVLDSPGGDVDSGLDFIRWAKQYSNIHTITLFAASMAAGIVEGLPGYRYVDEGGIIMFHRAAGQFQGQFEDGEVESRLSLAKEVIRSVEVTNANRLQLTLQEYKQQIKDEMWLFGSRSAEKHATDMVVGLKCDQQLIDAKEKVTAQVLVFAMDFDFSKCPLLRVGTPSNAASRNYYKKNKTIVDKKFSKPMLLI